MPLCAKIKQVRQLSGLAYIPTCRSPWNTNSLQHWPSPTMRRPVCRTTHGPRLSSQVCHTGLTTVERVIDFSIFWPCGAYPWAKGHQKGRWPTVHLDLPSYKISAWSRKWSTRYALPKFFTFWLGGLTPGPKFTKRGDDLVSVVDSDIYHPAKLHHSTPTHSRDICYQNPADKKNKQKTNKQ